MKRIICLLFLTFVFACRVFAQQTDNELKISLQTDLLAYLPQTDGGWNAWAAIQKNQNKLSLAYVNIPNRYSEDQDDFGITDKDSFIRLQLARYINPDTKLKNFFYGFNLQYHFRELTENNNPNSIDVNGFKIAPILGYEWHPWNKKENTLGNFSLVLWAGPTFLFGDGFQEEQVFSGTGTIYPAREDVEVSAGVMISYTIFRNN